MEGPEHKNDLYIEFRQNRQDDQEEELLDYNLFVYIKVRRNRKHLIWVGSKQK